MPCVRSPLRPVPRPEGLQTSFVAVRASPSEPVVEGTPGGDGEAVGSVSNEPGQLLAVVAFRERRAAAGDRPFPLRPRGSPEGLGSFPSDLPAPCVVRIADRKRRGTAPRLRDDVDRTMKRDIGLDQDRSAIGPEVEEPVGKPFEAAQHHLARDGAGRAQVEDGERARRIPPASPRRRERRIERPAPVRMCHANEPSGTGDVAEPHGYAVLAQSKERSTDSRSSSCRSSAISSSIDRPP
jgi:hypothetical protein